MTVPYLDDTTPELAHTQDATHGLSLVSEKTRDALCALARTRPATAVCIDSGPGTLGDTIAAWVATSALTQLAAQQGVDASDLLADLTLASPTGDRWTVEEVDERILRRSSLRPSVCNVIVISRADTMTPATADRLLTVMERPQAPTWFILVCERVSDLRVTVQGRMAQVVVLERLSGSAYVDQLVSYGAPRERATVLAQVLGPLVEVSAALATREEATTWAEQLDLSIDASAQDRLDAFDAVCTVMVSLGHDQGVIRRELVRQVIRVARTSLKPALRTADRLAFGVCQGRLAMLDDSQRLLDIHVPPRAVLTGVAQRWHMEP